MNKIEVIEKLLEEHLISWYQPDMDSLKAHYRVTAGNLIDFIDKYFVLKK